MRHQALMAFAVVAVAVLPPRSASAQCQPGRGGTMISEGDRFEVEILPGNPLAAYTSDLYLAIPGRPSINFGTNWDVGRVTQLGKIDVGTEMIFRINVRNISKQFFSGPASRNPDGVAHADVACLANRSVRYSFEDGFAGGNFSYNDLLFIVRPKGCSTSTRSAVTELISGYPSCGPAARLSPVWGRFGSRAQLLSDEGETLELECVASGVNYYALYYSGLGRSHLRVGVCPFEGGCNEAFFVHSGDQDNNGKPDCFLLTSWTSKDYGSNDNPNPWTGQTETTPVLDHARSLYDVVGDKLVKEDLKFAYAVPPPVSCRSARRAEGSALGVERVDPPLGPETEAFFQAATNRLAQLRLAPEPMEESPLNPADLNDDGIADSSDTAIFDAAIGACSGSSTYDVRADFDADGCVTFADQQIVRDLVEALLPSGPTRFFPLTPCRVVDTRGTIGPYGGPALSAGSSRSFAVRERCGIPTSALALAVNVTAVQPSTSGNLRLYPGGTFTPTTSAISYGAGVTRANNGLTRLGPSGDVAIRCDQASGTVHVVLDVTGYFAASAPPSDEFGSRLSPPVLWEQQWLRMPLGGFHRP